jgi:transposase InsO family protein
MPDQKKTEALRWLRILAEFEAYATQCGRKNRTKARKDFCQLYRTAHPVEKLSPSRLKAKSKQLREEGLTGLAPAYGKTRIFASWCDETKAFLKQLYLHENQPTARWCIAQTRLEATKHNWTLPSNETMQRFLSQIPQETKDFYRKGEKFWRQTYIPSVLRDYESLRPGEIFVADHRQLDIACRFPDGKVGFPWLTAVLDMRSRMLVGWHLDLIPSTATILLALEHAFEGYGLPTYVLFDNGRDFSSRLLSGGNKRFRLRVDEEEFTGVLLQLMIKVMFALPANARSKIIERWFKDMGDFERAWPTFRGNKIAERPAGVDARIKRGVDVPDLQDVHDALQNFIADKNRNHLHSGDGMDGRTPKEVWDEYFQNHAVRRASPESLRLLFMKGKISKVNRFGVAALNSLYRADALEGLVGQSVTYRFDPSDFQKILIYKPDGSFLCEAHKLNRTPWNDETELVRLKHFEKQRKRAIKSGMEADREIMKIETGYRPVPLTEEAPIEEKVIRICRTPLDGVAAQIANGDDSENSSRSLVREAMRRRYGTIPDVDETRPKKALSLLHGGAREREDEG